MKLTEKDKLFLERLRLLVEEKDLWIEPKNGPPRYLVLRGNYGDKISNAFQITRQGVRWRFWHIFNEIYVSAYETIYFVETAFGTSLRQAAMEISKERFALREHAKQASFITGDRLAHKDKD